MDRKILKNNIILEDFKNKFIYSELDAFGAVTKIITTNDSDSARFVSGIVSLVYSILNMYEDEYKTLIKGKHKSYHTIMNHLEHLIKGAKYRSLFKTKNVFMLYGYNNCCFLFNTKEFEKYEGEQPMYCEYLIIKTMGLDCYRFNPYMHLWIRALQTVYYQWMTIRKDVWKEQLDRLIENYSHDEDFPLLSSTIDIPFEPDRFNIANALVHYIRKDANHLLVLKEIRNFKETPKRNEASAQEYVDYLFSIYSKLTVIRVDLGYKRIAFDKLNNSEAYSMIRRDRDRLFANMRHNTLFKHRVGFISKLEYGLDKGYHYHLILFFDGNKVQRDQYIASQICRYWNENIAGGNGNAFNCHAKKDEYKYKGIGKISYKDIKLRENLMDYVIRYLIKPELFARLVVPGDAAGAHVFERGQIKAVIYRKGKPRGKELIQAA